MDYGRENVVQVIPTSSENWSNDQSVWATEDDYRAWSNGDLHSPPSKKPKNNGSQTPDSNRSKAIGKMFFKTKLCCKFRAGTCPYVTNCNFAHSVEELRRPPPNWQEIVAAHDEDRTVISPPREEFQIPSIGFAVEAPRSYKGRHCKKFYTEEGCPYGESCTFLHDEQSKNRESVAISLGGGGGGGSGGGGIVIVGAPSASGAVNKPSNWKTRICNKWELTGYCPFGSKCHFAHGQTELHRYGGGLMENDGRDSSSTPAETKQPPKTSETMAASVPSAPLSDVYHIGVPSQRASMVIQRPGQRVHHKWKGPDKISRIYGDWIDDVE